MTPLRIRTFPIIPPLRPYLDRIFYSEFPGQIGQKDAEFIPPNGKLKLLIPTRNSIRSTIGGKTWEHRSSGINVVGVSSYSAFIENDREYANLCVEFQPFGAYRFFAFSLRELSGLVVGIENVWQGPGAKLLETMAESKTLAQKVDLLQTFLLKRLVAVGKQDPITEYAVKKILERRGMIRVEALCEHLGYSPRQVYAKFSDHVGIGPKEFCEVIRFIDVFKGLKRGTNLGGFPQYYDQSHFIRDFRKFSNGTPGEYLSRVNVLRTLIAEPV